ncbi:putative hydrolase [Rhodobacterales bacterium HTCC2150]|nr:putative hydrolase [Rhodobacterales bacterium HTCC2150] [Rhodobacteraceae bacterium HTCC2150]
MTRTTVHCLRKIPVDPDRLWVVLGTFDLSWHPFVASCDLLRSPQGALLRSFTDGDGQTYEERRTYLSDRERVLCYELESGIDGIQSYAARIEVTKADEGSLITWHADIVAVSDRVDAIAEGTRAIFEAALDTLVSAPSRKSIKRRQMNVASGHITPTKLEGMPTLGLRSSEGEKGETGALVLFLHGIGGNAKNWDNQLRALCADYDVAALDLRGYGTSTLGFAQSTIDDYCADILHVMETRGASRLVLAGLSYGSWIATSFAMRHSDILRGLILAGGCTGMSEADPSERENFRITREVPLNAGQTPADFAPAVVNVIAGPRATEAQRNELRQSMEEIPAATYRDALNCFCNPLEKFEFARIDCPVLMFTGEHDRLAPPSEIRRVSERIMEERRAAAKNADVHFEVISDVGHVCNLEAADETNALIHRFLSRLPSVARNYKSSVLERQREKRARIRQAAHDEFCENGYDGASMDRIATRADVSKPTLYQYFGGKDGLMEAVLDVGRMQIVAPLMAKDGPLVDRLWRFAWVYADFVLRPDMLSLARLILGEAARRPENAIAYHQNGPARAFEGLVEFVTTAVAAGELECDVPELAAQNLWSLILSGPRDYYLHHVDKRPTENELLTVIGHGLHVFLKAYGVGPKILSSELDAMIKAKAKSLKERENAQ